MAWMSSLLGEEGVPEGSRSSEWLGDHGDHSTDWDRRENVVWMTQEEQSLCSAICHPVLIWVWQYKSLSEVWADKKRRGSPSEQSEWYFVISKTWLKNIWFQGQCHMNSETLIIQWEQHFKSSKCKILNAKCTFVGFFKGGFFRLFFEKFVSILEYFLQYKSWFYWFSWFVKCGGRKKVMKLTRS